MREIFRPSGFGGLTSPDVLFHLGQKALSASLLAFAGVLKSGKAHLVHGHDCPPLQRLLATLALPGYLLHVPFLSEQPQQLPTTLHQGFAKKAL